MLFFGTAAIGVGGLHIDRRAIEVLYLITPPCLLDVAREGPLANAPVLDLALRALILMTWHLRGAPIRLTCHAAEVATAGRGEVDADVMTSGIINEGGTHAIPEVSGESLARGGAGLQLLTVNVRVTSLSSSHQGGGSGGDRWKCKRLHLALAFIPVIDCRRRI